MYQDTIVGVEMRAGRVDPVPSGRSTSQRLKAGRTAVLLERPRKKPQPVKQGLPNFELNLYNPAKRFI